MLVWKHRSFDLSVLHAVGSIVDQLAQGIVNKKESEGVRLSCAMASETLAAVARLDDEAFERWCKGIKSQLSKLKADQDNLWDVLLKAMDERIARGKRSTAKVKLVATSKAKLKPRQPKEPPPSKFVQLVTSSTDTIKPPEPREPPPDKLLRRIRRGIIGARKAKW